MIPLRTDSPLRATPWMNWALIAANVLVFVVERALDKMGYGYFSYRMHLNPADPHLWNFFSYAFLHADIIHLLSNMLFLYIFGNNINDRLGHVGYLAFYLAGAIIAGAGFVVADASGLPVVGASGAVMAVMGAYLALYPRSNITVLSLLVFVGTFEVPSMYLIIVFFVLDLVGNLAGSVSVAHVAHISGLAFGFGIGMGLLAVKLLPRDPFDFLALVQRWNRRRQYKVLVRQGYNPFAYAARPMQVRVETRGGAV